MGIWVGTDFDRDMIILRNQVFLDVKLCCCVSGSQCFKGLYCLHFRSQTVVGDTFLPYVWNYIPTWWKTICLQHHYCQNLNLGESEPVWKNSPRIHLQTENVLKTFVRVTLTYSMVQSPSWEANWFAASQEIHRISRNPKVNFHTHERLPPVSTLGQPNPVHIHTSHLLEIHPNIIHPSTPRSPQWSPSLQFPHQEDPISNHVLKHKFCQM